jgi:exopolysaccharide biosynthesis operon protein EpsL
MHTMRQHPKENLMMKKLISTVVPAAVLIMAAPAAFAQGQAQIQAPVGDDPAATEGLHVRGILGVEHDSNVLRVPSSANPVSDTMLQAGVGLSFNKRYGLQRVRADVEYNTFRYSDENSLNFNTLNYALAWDWRVTPRFHGVVSADRRQFREVTTDPLLFTNRVGRRTERNEVAEGVFEVGGPWSVLAGVSHYRANSDQPLSWDASPDIQYWHVGAGYKFASGTSFTARYRRGEGEYRDPSFTGVVNRDFRDHETELAAHWALTAKTIFDGRIGHRKREHQGAPQLDFDGIVANANVVYDLTGKIRVVAGYGRDLSATGLTSGGHVTSNRFYIAPVYRWSAKTSFTARYDRTNRDWSGVPASVIGFDRSETIQSVQIGADWQALRTISVSPYIRHERLSSSVSNGYRATVYGIAAKANF